MKPRTKIGVSAALLTGALGLSLWLSQPSQTVTTTAAPPSPQAALPITSSPETEASVLAQASPAKHIPDRELFGSAWATSPRAELSAFSSWASRYLDASPAERAALEAEGVPLAAARRELMLKLIQDDPRAAIAATLPVAIRHQLPQSIQSLLEARVSGEGDVYRVMGVPPPGSKQVVPTVHQAHVGDLVYQAHPYGDRALTPSLKAVSIHGVALEGHLAVLDSPVRKLEVGETAKETSETCIVTNNVVVTPKLATASPPSADVASSSPATETPPAEKTTMLVGTHGYTMCCPFCAEDFETRLERLERQQVSAMNALGAIAADADTPRALSSSGVDGSADYPGKPPASLTQATNNMIVMRVDFPDYPYNGLSEQYLNDQVNSCAWMINRFSYGKSQLAAATITPVLRMPRNRGTYDNSNYWGDILNDARAAAFALGYNPDAFSCRVIVHDGFVSGGAAGWGGGGAIWCNGYAQDRLLLHEYGHVFWLPHANSWQSNDGNPLSPSRWHVEYGDASDPMGDAWNTSGNSDFNAYYKNLLGWLPDSAVVPVTHSGVYRINQFDGWGDWTKPVVLKITRDNDLDLWVMFRGDGVPQGLYNSGAYIVAANGERFGDSHVLDMNNTNDGTVNAPLAQGQSWTDAASGITITTAGRMMNSWPHHMYVKVEFPADYQHGYRPLVNGGVYALRNKSFNQFLSVPGNSASNGTEPVVAPYTGGAEQQWVALRNPEGNYRLEHNGTGKVLDVLGNAGGNYAEIVQWDWNGADNQRWDVVNSWDGYLKFRHRNTNQVLTADTAAANSGDVIQYDDFSGDEQKWEPYLVGINNGTYRLVPRHAPTRALALRDRSSAVGTQVEQQFWTGGAWQRWTMLSVGGGQFRIHPEGQPGVTLAISGASTAEGASAVLETYTGANHQKFTFVATGMGFVRLTPVHAPAMCLDVTASGTDAGAGIRQWTYLGANNQQWRFIDSNL